MEDFHFPRFVGREAEFAELQGLFAGVVAGHGALGLVVGEAGIGKTALCRQLASYVLTHGGRAMTGHCDEAGELSSPYLPFIEAFGAGSPAGATGSRAAGEAAWSLARLPAELRGDFTGLDASPGWSWR